MHLQGVMQRTVGAVQIRHKVEHGCGHDHSGLTLALTTDRVSSLTSSSRMSHERICLQKDARRRGDDVNLGDLRCRWAR
jgi:hypothetical protein